MTTGERRDYRISLPDGEGSQHGSISQTRRPDGRDLRYRILRALRAGIGDHKNADKIEGLIENHHGCGLRLSCTTQVLRARDELAG